MTPPKTTRLVFDGALGPMFRMHIVNRLLTILTLGVYSFWAKARVRRYLASHTTLLGDRLEYTGTGWELLRGFLIFMIGVYLPLVAAVGAAVVYLPAEAAGFVGGAATLFLLFLLPVGRYLGTRYRLSRTQWRSVRFGLDGRAWVFALATLVSWLMSVASLLLAAPQAQLLRERYRLNNIAFGDLEGHVTAQFYKAPYWSWALLIGDVIALAALIWFVREFAVLYVSLPNFQMADIFNFEVIFLYLKQVSLSLVYFFIVSLFTSIFIIYFWHQSRMLIFVVEKFRLLGEGKKDWVAFHPPQQPGEFLYLMLGNFILTVVTLGFAAPITWQRTMAYVSRFTVINPAALESAAQNALRRPRDGEGLLEAFDIGAV